jgi:hypothetical protein
MCQVQASHNSYHTRGKLLSCKAMNTDGSARDQCHCGIRRAAMREEPIADDTMPGRQTPPRPWPGLRMNLAQAVGRSPVLGRSGERRRIGRADRQDSWRYRQQRMQVERTGPAVANLTDRPHMMRLDPLTELARQDAAAGDRQVPLCRRRCHGEVEHVLFDAGEIEPPRDDTGTVCLGGKPSDLTGRPGDRQVMVQPVGRRRW